MFSMARRLARLMIETTLRATSEKLWPRLGEDFWRSLDLAGMLAGENTARWRPGLRRFRDRPGPRSRRSRRMVRTWLVVVEMRAAAPPAIRPAAASGNAASASIWARPDRSRSGRSRWRSGGRPAASGPTSSADGRQRFRGEAFDGIAVDPGDLGRAELRTSGFLRDSGPRRHRARNCEVASSVSAAHAHICRQAWRKRRRRPLAG